MDDTLPSLPPVPGSDSASQTSTARPDALPADTPVVGIGASGGGLESLLRFLNKLPDATGMAFLVMLKLSRELQGNAHTILQRATALKVVDTVEPVELLADHIYVLSPGTDLSISKDRLDATPAMSDLSTEKKPNAIDPFFRALANARGEQSIGIVLSGTGADGALGITYLKEHGGYTFAQLPADAEYADLPQAAIDTGSMDFVMPVADMPAKLLELWTNVQSIRLPIDELDTEQQCGREVQEARVAHSPVERSEQSERALQEVIELLRTETGNDFHDYKRATVLRRIERRMQVCAVKSLTGYRDILRSSNEEIRLLHKDMLIGVTQFFRDHEAFIALELDILPQLFAGRSRNDGGEPIRAWSAACSTGEEAYSLAMLLSEQATLMPDPPQIQVFGSDVDERAIAIARAGVYSTAIASDLTAPRLNEYFTAEENRYRVRKPLRDRIMFASQNLLRDPPFSRLDLISCRNLLIYLNRDVHAKVLEMFHFALNPNGFLILGSSESADAMPDYFTLVDKRNRIYQAKAVTRHIRSAHVMPVYRQHAFPSEPATKFHPMQKFSYAHVHNRVLVNHAPPSVLVNQDSNILYMSEGAGQFLRYVAGEPTRNLTELVEPELRLELRTALFQAIHGAKFMETRRIEIRRDGKPFLAQISVRPFHDTEVNEDFILVVFQRFEADQELSQSGPSMSALEVSRDAVLAGLEADLLRTKGQLQDTIEHSEISTEELKASNEELQAINEELRSATEELETSKEELQSVNEELVTVNHELKNKIEETSKTNDDLQNLIASTDIATIFVDRAMRIKRYTPRASSIFNILPGDIGRSLHDITHKLDYDELANDAAATFETLRVVEREVFSTAGRTYIARLLPYRTVYDRIDGAIITFIDITGRRQAEEKLRAGEERMRLVAESTRDYSIITTDVDGLITSFSNGAERMFGYAEGEVRGRAYDLIFTPEDRASGVPEEERRRAHADGRVEDERWQIRKDGTRFYCSGVMTPLRDGEFFGYARIGFDLTGRLQAEKLRIEQITRDQVARAQAQAANTLKEEFLAIVSHELKHPLNLIHMNAELLLRLPQMRERVAARAATTIRACAVSQARIINDLLDISRLKSGKLPLTLAYMDLAATVQKVVKEIAQDPAAAALQIRLEPPADSMIIHADIERIEQVLWNVLDNAVKHTPTGGIIDIRLGREDSFAHCEISDDGKSFSAAQLAQVFGPLRSGTAGTADNAASEVRGSGDADEDDLTPEEEHTLPQAGSSPPGNAQPRGLGIGLGLSRQIVELHGGRMEAQSNSQGKGTIFRIWVSAHGGQYTVEAGLPADARAAVAGLRILLIDDMPDALDIFRILLEYHGAIVESTTSARTALAMLDTHRFDLVMSDIGMPDLDGYTFIREMRNHPGYQDTPAIAVTGFGRAKDIERALESGYDEHISKPVAIDAVLRKVSQLGLPRTSPMPSPRDDETT